MPAIRTRPRSDLIEAANRAGGKDNITVVVVEGDQFTAPAFADPDEPRSGLLASRGALFAVRPAGGGGDRLVLAGMLGCPPPVVIAPRTFG